jgi:hypothetical protein
MDLAAAIAIGRVSAMISARVRVVQEALAAREVPVGLEDSVSVGRVLVRQAVLRVDRSARF